MPHLLEEAARPSFGSPQASRERGNYVSLILHIMARDGTGQRKLSLKTGISKSRLGVLLHRDPAKRASMTVEELETILEALDTSIIPAVILMETFAQEASRAEERYGTLIVMLCEFFLSLPRKLIDVLDALEGLDGSEVRREWASPLQKAVVKRVTEEVIAVTERRARLAQSDDFRL